MPSSSANCRQFPARRQANNDSVADLGRGQCDSARLNLVAKVNEATASSIQLRELALLDALENRYRRDTVIPMPYPETPQNAKSPLSNFH